MGAPSMLAKRDLVQQVEDSAAVVVVAIRAGAAAAGDTRACLRHPTLPPKKQGSIGGLTRKSMQSKGDAYLHAGWCQ